jgi:hypothetical protein
MEKWSKAFIVCLGLLAIASKAESIQSQIITTNEIHQTLNTVY